MKLQSVFNVFLAQRYPESPLPVVQCCAKSGKAASGSGEFQFCNKHWIRWQRVRVSQFLWLIVGVAIIGNFYTGLYFFWTSRGEGKFPRGLLINITNSFFFAHIKIEIIKRIKICLKWHNDIGTNGPYCSILLWTCFCFYNKQF